MLVRVPVEGVPGLGGGDAGGEGGDGRGGRGGEFDCFFCDVDFLRQLIRYSSFSLGLTAFFGREKRREEK